MEVRNGSGNVLKQQVWGQRYVDELVQVRTNSDPTADDTCDTRYWVCQDANYNVLGHIDVQSRLVERYEYTPYGERTVFFSAGANDPDLMAPTLMSRRIPFAGGVYQPYGLNEFGHQGLHHDEELGLVYNRARSLHPTLGRFMQRDPWMKNASRPSARDGYQDGLSLYGYLRSEPVGPVDPAGTDRSIAFFTDAHWFLAIESWTCNRSTGEWKKGRAIEYDFSIDWEEANRQPHNYLMGTIGLFVGAPARLTATTSDKLPPEGDLITSSPCQDYVAHQIISPEVNYPKPEYNGKPYRYNILTYNCRHWSALRSNAGMGIQNCPCDCRKFLDSLNTFAPPK